MFTIGSIDWLTGSLNYELANNVNKRYCPIVIAGEIESGADVFLVYNLGLVGPWQEPLEAVRTCASLSRK